MPVAAILGIVTSVLSIASSLQGFVDSLNTAAQEDDTLSRSEREKLSQVLAGMTLVPDIVQEMQGTIEGNQTTIDARPGLTAALDAALVSTRNNAELVQGRLETIDFSGKGSLSDGDIDDLQSLLRTIMKSQDIADSGTSEAKRAERIVTTLDRSNLFTLAVLLDNMTWFGKKPEAGEPANDVDKLRTKLGKGNIPNAFVVNGAFTTEVQTTDQQLGG